MFVIICVRCSRSSGEKKGGQISAYDDIAVQHHIQAADCKCQVPQIILPDFRKCRITETQLREKGGNISTGSMLQAVCGTVGFQTAPFSAIAEGTIGIDAHMFDGTAVHTQAVMYFSVQYDGAAQILVQQNNNGITEFFLMPGLQITGSLGVVLQTAGVGNMAGKIRKLHTRMVQYPAIADRRAVSGDQTLDRDCGPQDPAWGKRVFFRESIYCLAHLFTVRQRKPGKGWCRIPAPEYCRTDPQRQYEAFS